MHVLLRRIKFIMRVNPYEETYKINKTNNKLNVENEYLPCGNEYR
jgi:hypothetical protein